MQSQNMIRRATNVVSKQTRLASKVAQTQVRTCVTSSKPLATATQSVKVSSIPSINNVAQSTRTFATSTDISTVAKPDEITWTSDIQRTSCGLYVDKGLPQTFKKILIANRGEIACRVIRTCRELGIKTVAVFSDADANSMFVKMADEAYNIGPAASAQSYLRGDYIIQLAKQCGAQAIHPGYGFLSENAEFAKNCFESGIEFMGPPVPAITAMGSKSASKNIMNAAGVRCVPGYHGEDQTNETLFKEATKTGYPIMLKAVSGGGGKGMRIVRGPEDFQEALDGCRREAMASFKDDRVLLERYIENPRHIEFQVFADKQGNAVHLFERDCSVQRRHQKVLEEAPAPGMTEELRAQMGKSATDAAQAVGYVGAGTVEFIFDADTDEYFFMEMNTRLQVEHCVSEMIVQRDLVQWQLHVAAGYRLPVASQADIQAKGHALELRVYAENPYNNFFPATGKLTHLVAPALASDVRVETGVRQGDEVSIHYDPMISKLVTWGPNRDACLKRMLTAIDDYEIVGPPTNLSFAKLCIEHPAFAKGQVTTKFIASYLDTLVPAVKAPSTDIAYLTTLQLLLKEQQEAKVAFEKAAKGPWASSSSFRVNDNAPMRKVKLEVSGQGTGDKKDSVAITVRYPKTVTIKTGTMAVEMSVDGVHFTSVQGSIDENGRVKALVGENMLQGNVVVDKATNEVHVFSNHGTHSTFRFPTKTYGASLAAGSGAFAPMAGKIVKVNVKAGDVVKANQPLVVMEAMKMEHVLRAAEAGVVKSVLFTTGDFVEGGKAVVTFVEQE